jgi:hypothetical protein
VSLGHGEVPATDRVSASLQHHAAVQDQQQLLKLRHYEALSDRSLKSIARSCSDKREAFVGSKQALLLRIIVCFSLMIGSITKEQALENFGIFDLGFDQYYTL